MRVLNVPARDECRKERAQHDGDESPRSCAAEERR